MADKSIVDLPQLSEVTDATLIPVYQPNSDNPAQKMPSSVFRNWAEDAVFPAAKTAQEAAVTATEAEVSAQSALSGVRTAIKNIPAGATPIVNDLTTGGVSMALSAEMGKVLRQTISALTAADVGAMQEYKYTAELSATGWYRVCHFANRKAANQIFLVLGSRNRSQGVVACVNINNVSPSVTVLSSCTETVFTQIRVIPTGSSSAAVDVWYNGESDFATAKVIPFASYGAFTFDELMDVTDATDTAFLTHNIDTIASGNVLTDATPLYDLLWENASKSSSFAEQTIMVNTAGYDYLMVVSGYNSTSEGNGQGVNIVRLRSNGKGTSVACLFVDYFTSANALTRPYRKISIASGRASISFSGGYKQDGTASDSNVIPYYIYGIKGVSNP